MAIKYGRPMESKVRFVPVETGAPASPKLDLTTRPRRNRRSDWARRMVREHVLTTDDLIWPMFIVDGAKTRVPVPSMPGVERLTVDEAVREAERAAKLAHPLPRAVSLYRSGLARRRRQRGAQSRQPRLSRHARDQEGSAGDRHSLRRRARSLHEPWSRRADAAMARSSTTRPSAVLVRQALLAGRGRLRHHRAVRHDGRPRRRDPRALDEAGCHDVQIMAYAAKYASAFYGPFRDAVGSAATLTGDKRTYQMDPATPTRRCARWSSTSPKAPTW